MSCFHKTGENIFELFFKNAANVEEDPGEEFDWKPPDLVSINGIWAVYKGAGVVIWQYIKDEKTKRQKDKEKHRKNCESAPWAKSALFKVSF